MYSHVLKNILTDTTKTSILEILAKSLLLFVYFSIPVILPNVLYIIGDNTRITDETIMIILFFLIVLSSNLIYSLIYAAMIYKTINQLS